MEERSILIVEDNYAFEGRAIELFLQQHGYSSILSATNVEEAVRVALNERPQVIIMDVDLHDRRWGGVEAAQRIRKYYAPTVIYLTGHSTAEYAEKVMEGGAITLRKPCDYKSLLENIRNAFAAPPKPGPRWTLSPPSGPLQYVFISYAHEQMEQKLQLTKQLKALEHYGPIRIWDDGQLIPGKRWLPEILKVIDQCQLAVLMLSSDYVDGDGFIMRVELPHILGRERADTLQILPIVARPYDIEAVPLLSERQLWNRRAIWLREDWDADATLASLTQRVREMLQSANRTESG